MTAIHCVAFIGRSLLPTTSGASEPISQIGGVARQNRPVKVRRAPEKSSFAIPKAFSSGAVPPLGGKRSQRGGVSSRDGRFGAIPIAPATDGAAAVFYSSGEPSITRAHSCGRLGLVYNLPLRRTAGFYSQGCDAESSEGIRQSLKFGSPWDSGDAKNHHRLALENFGY